MPRSLNKSQTSRELALLPRGVPLLTRPIEAADLMLAALYRHPFSDTQWLYELKYK
jgi:hypothetical protein